MRNQYKVLSEKYVQIQEVDIDSTRNAPTIHNAGWLLFPIRNYHDSKIVDDSEQVNKLLNWFVNEYCPDMGINPNIYKYINDVIEKLIKDRVEQDGVEISWPGIDSSFKKYHLLVIKDIYDKYTLRAFTNKAKKIADQGTQATGGDWDIEGLI